MLELLGLLSDKRKQPRILQRGQAMPDTRKVVLVCSERQERFDAGLAYEHDSVPALLTRTDQELTPPAEKEHLASRLFQVRKRVRHVKAVGGLSSYWRGRRKLRCGRVVRNGSKPQQVEHYDAAGNAAGQECPTRFLRRLKVAFGLNGQLFLLIPDAVVYFLKFYRDCRHDFNSIGTGKVLLISLEAFFLSLRTREALSSSAGKGLQFLVAERNVVATHDQAKPCQRVLKNSCLVNSIRPGLPAHEFTGGLADSHEVVRRLTLTVRCDAFQCSFHGG